MDGFPIGDVNIGSSGWLGWFSKVKAILDKLGFSQTRITNGIDTTDEIIVDSTTAGLVLKSPNLHYWRATISNAGVVTWTDLGTTKP